MGSHSLPKQLADRGLSEIQIAKKLEQCETAVKYQMYHSLACLAIGLSGTSLRKRGPLAACSLFFCGMLLFSGGLYSMVFFDYMGHWSIVPLGGVTLMCGWLTLAIAFVFDASR